MLERHTGGCLCGSVEYVVNGPLRDVVFCHCTMCQRLHGGTGCHSKALKAHLQVTTDTGLAWYKSSEIAQRGYCKSCGSSLFWDAFDQDSIGILAGSLDDSSGLRTIGHIFVGEKARFYEISDELPKFEGTSDGELPGDYK